MISASGFISPFFRHTYSLHAGRGDRTIPHLGSTWVAVAGRRCGIHCRTSRTAESRTTNNPSCDMNHVWNILISNHVNDNDNFNNYGAVNGNHPHWHTLSIERCLLPQWMSLDYTENTHTTQTVPRTRNQSRDLWPPATGCPTLPS